MKATLYITGEVSQCKSTLVSVLACYDSSRNQVAIVLRTKADRTAGHIVLDPVDVPEIINALMAARAQSKRAGQGTGTAAATPDTTTAAVVQVEMPEPAPETDADLVPVRRR